MSSTSSNVNFREHQHHCVIFAGLFRVNLFIEQECIPVGCISSTAVAIGAMSASRGCLLLSGGCLLLGGGVCPGEGVSVQGTSVNRMTLPVVADGNEWIQKISGDILDVLG